MQLYTLEQRSDQYQHSTCAKRHFLRSLRLGGVERVFDCFWEGPFRRVETRADW